MIPGIIEGDAPGALAKGTRIVKCRSVEGQDTHADGSPGTVYSSFGPVDLNDLPEEARLPGNEFGYFVIWDDLPDHPPVLVGGSRIMEA